MLFTILNNSFLNRYKYKILKMTPEKHKKKEKKQWIEKDLKSIIPKLDKKTIFVPSQNELLF